MKRTATPSAACPPTIFAHFPATLAAALLLLAPLGCGEGGSGGSKPGDGGTGGTGGTPGTDAGAPPRNDGGAPPAAMPGVPGVFTEMPCPFMRALPRPARCGFVGVPEVRGPGAPDKTIKIFVVILKSDSPTPQPDPLVFLQGGPGGGGSALVDSGAAESKGPFGPALAKRDLVVIDQRGTGRSQPLLDCPEVNMAAMMPPGMGGMGMMMGDVALAPLGKCRERLIGLGINLDSYDTVAAAADVEDVRKALGIAQWNLLGASYGTRLALEVFRQHPAGVRTLILDSVAPPDVDLIGDAPNGYARALERVFESCAAQPTCNTAYPQLRQAFVTAVTSLEAMPASILFGAVPVNATTFVYLVTNFLSVPEMTADLPEVIFQAKDRKFSALEMFLLNMLTRGGGGGAAAAVSMGLHLSVMCADFMPFTSKEAIETRGMMVAADLRKYLLEYSRPYPERCRVWNVMPSPPATNQPVTGPVPALVLAGQIDPATPVEWAKKAAMALPMSQFFELRGTGHGAIRNPCATDLVAKFLDAPQAKVPSACVDALKEVQYNVKR